MNNLGNRLLPRPPHSSPLTDELENHEDEHDPDERRRDQPPTPRSRFRPDALESLSELPRRLETRLGIFLQQSRDDVLETSGNLLIESPRRIGGSVQDGIEHCRRRFSNERLRPRRHLVEHHAQREQISPRVNLLPERLLRRHVGDGAHQDVRARLRSNRRRHTATAWADGLEELGQAEVDDLRVGRRA